MNLLIAGSRSIVNEEFCHEIIREYLCNNEYPIENIISGKARGVDTFAITFAYKYGYQTIEMPVHGNLWKKHGKKAGNIRNSKMILLADCVLVIWDGESKGTKDTIDKCKLLNIDLVVYNTKKGRYTSG